MYTNNNKRLKTTLLQGAAMCCVAVMATAPAFAQEAVSDEVVVTGSRITRANLESTSPVTSIGADVLDSVNTVNTEEFINTLPQAVPGLGSTSNNPGNGTATVSLRGLGSNRTLVLVDGHRYVSANGNGVVDLNSVPSALVKRVDVVTGGASAVYGSDAMAGVVNFILEDSFEGVEIASTYEISEQGDGAKKDASITLGGNFDNGRGNATVFASFSQRDAVFQGDREYSRVANGDPGADGTAFTPFGSAGVPGTRLFDGFDFTNAGYATDGTSCTAPAGGSSEGLSGTCTGGATFDAGGQIIPWINAGTNTSRYNYAPVNYLQLPQDRYTLAAFGRYDITDTVELKLRSIFTSNTVPQELAPTPFFSTVTIDVENNPFLTDGTRAALRSTAAANLISAQTAFDDAVADGSDQATLNGLQGVIDGLDADGDAVAELFPVGIGRRMLEVGPRNNTQELQSMQISADLSGAFGGDWEWDLHGHISRTSGSQVQTGNLSISAMQAVVASGECNIFGANNFSQDCVDSVSRTGVLQQTSQQHNLIATTGGSVDMIQSPLAENPLQLIVGVEYREDSFDFRPDSVLGPDVAGFLQALPVNGTTDSYEAFGEVYLPLVAGKEFMEELSFSGAYRYTSHNTVGGFSSYSAGLEWQPVSDIRFRGQLQRSVRAPNVVELFAAQTNGFPGAQDPCSRGVSDATQVATGIEALCVAGGVPAANFNTQFQANGQVEALFGGNPNLEVETSDTFTLGFVLTPSAIEGLSITVDWYDIGIDDAIGTIPVQNVLDGCYGGSVPAFCENITRRANGLLDIISLNNQNVAFLGAEGVDVQVDYSWDAADMGFGMPGELSLQLIGGYAISNEFQALPTDVVDDCVGYHGGNAGICGEPLQEWKSTARLTYANGPYRITTRWRYLSNTYADDYHPRAVADSGPGDLFAPKTGSYSYFDLTGSWDVTDVLQLSGGVLNAFDKNPPIFGSCCSEQANTWPATFRTLGRKFYVGAKVSF